MLNLSIFHIPHVHSRILLVFGICLTVLESQDGENKANFLPETTLTNLFLVVMFNHPSCLLNTNQLGYCLEFSFPHYRQAVSKAYCIFLMFASFFPLLTSCRTIDFSFESLEAYLILGIFIVISWSLQAMMLMALFVACHFDCGGLLFVCLVFLSYSTVFSNSLWLTFNIIANSWIQT